MLTAGTTLGPYKILDRLGAGGMGEVYRARDARLGRDVAIKVILGDAARDPDRIGRFEQEARAAGALSHPNICAVYDIGMHEGSPFVVMELLEGESLREKLRAGPIPARKAIDYAAQAAQGLAAAHAKQIVHRDIKPENLFVTRDGHLKILDFGIAKLADPSGSDELATVMTQAGATLGTAGYMSPEQLRGQSVDQRTDIFSLGCVVYEMLCGKPAFAGETPADIMTAVLGAEPAPLAGPSSAVPPGLHGIVRRSLEKRPEDRFSSAHDLALALNAIAEVLLTNQPPVEPAAKSVVVLPFENLSPDPENAFFADGLTEELIADLSKVRTLRVISRTSAMLLKGSKKDVPTIARELNVRHVLEGSVRRAGNSLRITAQLIDAAHDAHLWAEKYSGTLDDVFAIQEKVSAAIVQALQVTLTASERDQLAGRMIPDVKAFDLYLRARQETQRLSEAALDHAAQLVGQALDRVGPNSLLYALLAQIEFYYHDQGIHPDEETMRRAESWASKALDLDPECPGAFRARGVIVARRGDMAHAIQDLQRAHALEANGETLGYLVWACAEVGRMAEARQYAAAAVTLDPLLWFTRWSQAWVALFDGDCEVALERFQEAMSIGGGEPVQVLFVAIASAYAGHMEEARELFGQVADAKGSGISTIAGVLQALFRQDAEAAARLLSDQAVRHLGKLDKEFSWWLAAGCSYAGLIDEALFWLAGAIDLGFVNHHFISTIDPFLAGLRGDPRFAALLERARGKQRGFA